MRILILGGTGFMGSPLCCFLAARGHDLCILSRGQRVVTLPVGTRHIKGDRFDLAAIASQVDAFGPETVIDMTALTAQDDLPVLEFFAKRVRRYVLISSCDVYQAMGRIQRSEPGDIIPGLQSESGLLRQKLYPYRGKKHAGGDNYDKIPLEAACLNDFDFEATVLRLAMVYGPGDQQFRFRDMVKHMVDQRPAILFPQDYGSWISTYGFIDNIVAAIGQAATHEDAGGQVFNVGETNTLTQAQWASAFGRELGWSGEIILAPADTLPAKRGQISMAADFSQPLQIDLTKINALSGFVLPVDFSDAIRQTAAYERDHLGDVPAQAWDYAADDRFLAGYNGGN